MKRLKKNERKNNNFDMKRWCLSSIEMEHYINIILQINKHTKAKWEMHTKD
jgi:hypothetical protein